MQFPFYSKGEFFSDFFGGALVTNQDFQEVNSALEAKKRELNMMGEIKWTKVSANYLGKYMQMMDLFFSFIKQNKVKLRIMFQESGHSYSPLHQEHIANRYHLLYYQFIKDADGMEDFDISMTTLPDHPRDRRSIPYRHWRFQASEFKRKSE